MVRRRSRDGALIGYDARVTAQLAAKSHADQMQPSVFLSLSVVTIQGYLENRKQWTHESIMNMFRIKLPICYPATVVDKLHENDDACILAEEKH